MRQQDAPPAGDHVHHRSQHRPPVRHRRTNVAAWYIWGGLLLIFSFGIALAGIQAAHEAHDVPWCWFFITAAVIDVVLYFWIVRGWLSLID